MKCGLNERGREKNCYKKLNVVFSSCHFLIIASNRNEEKTIIRIAKKEQSEWKK
jgi:hypothetical protein